MEHTTASALYGAGQVLCCAGLIGPSAMVAEPFFFFAFFFFIACFLPSLLGNRVLHVRTYCALPVYDMRSLGLGSDRAPASATSPALRLRMAGHGVRCTTRVSSSCSLAAF